MVMLKGANLALALLLELYALAAIGRWGILSGQHPLSRAALGLGAPLLMATFWGFFLAPRASRRVVGTWSLLLKLLVFGGAALALASTGQAALEWTLALVAVIHLTLAFLWKQE